MMLKKLCTLLILSLGTAALSAQSGYTFNHGPYLQNLTKEGVVVYFTTSSSGFSRVELRKGGGDESKLYVSVDDGLVQANNTSNAIAISGLHPASEYEYRLVSKEIKSFRPYKVTFGDSIASPWYRFTTLDPKIREFSFLEISDIHDDAKKYSKLLSYMPMDSISMVFLVGDNVDYLNNAEQPYTGYIDASVKSFATEKPFVVVRGNHETRGEFAREFKNFHYRPNGHYYGLYQIGTTVIVMIDSGEDKPDTHPVYGGMVNFDAYRAEQAKWLTKVVKTKEFRGAEHRIVMVHIPPIDKRDRDSERTRENDHGTQQIFDLFMPILNRAKIDLMMSGHTHRQMFFEKKKGANNFPVVVNDNKSISMITVKPSGIYVRTVDINGKTTFNRTF